MAVTSQSDWLLDPRRCLRSSDTKRSSRLPLDLSLLSSFIKSGRHHSEETLAPRRISSRSATRVSSRTGAAHQHQHQNRRQPWAAPRTAAPLSTPGANPEWPAASLQPTTAPRAAKHASFSSATTQKPQLRPSSPVRQALNSQGHRFTALHCIAYVALLG